MLLFPRVMSRSKKGERNWNGKLTLFKPKSRVSHTGVGRKLQDVRQDLALLKEQGKVEGFFTNVKNADMLSGLVEDIRDAMIDYQVCVSDPPFLSCLISLRYRYNKICTTGASYSS